MQKRARRRQDLLRMKQRARRAYPKAERAHYWADYLRVCSCFLCTGNRKLHGPPFRELRAVATDIEGED